jgi:hypothetical protein
MADMSSAPPPAPSAPAPAGPKTLGEVLGALRLTTALALVGAVVMAVGSVGPWVDTVLGSVSGTHGDGQITLVAAGLVFVFVVVGHTRHGSRVSAVLATLAAVAGGATAAYDLSNIHDATADTTLFGTQLAQPGWGLYAVIAGAAVVVCCVLAGSRRP